MQCSPRKHGDWFSPSLLPLLLLSLVTVTRRPSNETRGGDCDDISLEMLIGDMYGISNKIIK